MGTPLKVLIIEDSENDALLMLHEIRRGGYEPASLRVDTKEALDSALKQEWDVILSDYSMPQFNGFEALRLVKEAGIDAPFVIVSGKVGEETAVQLMKTGAHDYIMKDNLKRLVPAIEREIREAENRKRGREAEEALRESERRLKEAQILGEIGNWEFDIIANKIEWSDEVYKLYERNRSLGPPSPEEEARYYLPDEAKRLREFSRLAIERGEDLNYDLTANLPSGKVAFFHATMHPVRDEKGQVTRLFGTVQNITEHKKAEEELRLRAEILDSATDAINLRELDGRIVYVNDAMTRMYGYSKDELTGMSARELLVPERQHAFGTRIDEAKEKGEVIFETTHQRKDGTLFPAEVHYRVIESGGKEYILSVVRDRTRLRQTQERLQEAEARYRTLFEQSPDGILLIDPETAGMIEFNDAVYKHLGYSREEMSRMRIFDFEVIEHPEETRQRISKILAQGQDNFITKHRDKDGDIRDVAVSVKTIEVSGRKLMFCIFRDITEQMRSEQALRASEERYRALVENAPVGIGLSTFDGRVLFRNSTLFEMSGYTIAELANTPVPNRYVDPKDWERLVELAKKGLVRDFEARMKHKNGTTYWVSYTAIPQKTEYGDGYLAISQDITERKQAEQALKASEERFRYVIENAPVGIGITTYDGQPVERNKAVVEIFGYDSREELLKVHSSQNYWNPEDRKRFLELAEKGIVKDFEVVMKRKDGTPFWASISSMPFTSLSGETQLITIVQDITRRKQAEEALRASEEKFRNLFENSPVGMAIATVDGRSVERNSTLQKMLGYDSKEELMKTSAADRYADPEDRKRFLELLGKGPVQNFEVIFKRKNGTPFWVSMTAIPLQDEPGGKFITVTLDITERKQAEEALKDSEERFRTLVENAPVGIGISALDGRSIYRNKTAANLYGFDSPEELIARTTAANYHDPRDRERFVALAKQGIVRDFEAKLKRKDGATFWGSITAIPYKTPLGDGFISVLQDITEKKQAEEALRASEERFRNLVESVPIGITISTVDGRIVLRNKALRGIYGYPSMEEFMKSPPVERFYNPEERQKFLEMALSGQGKNIEIQMKHQDGTPFWASLTSIPHILESGERALITVTQDVTERKRTEEALRASETRYRTLVENAPVGISITTPEGRAIERNRAVMEMHGYTSREEFLNLPVQARYYDIRDRERMLNLLKRGMVKDFEVQLKHKDGTLFWALLAAIPHTLESGEKTIITVTQDITERKQAEELFRTLTESSPVGIFIIQDWKFQSVNRQFLSYTGYTADEIRDRDFDTIISPDDRDEARRNIVSTLKDSLVYLAPHEYRIVNKSGEVRYALMMVAPITYHQKDAVIGSYIDITDYKNMERQVTEFKELDRMKTNLLSLVSHELRTPLSTIKGYTSLMLNYWEKLTENEKLEHLLTMDRAADRLTGLVQHLLDMSRLDAGLFVLNRAPTSLSGLLRETVAEAKVRIPTHELSLVMDKRLPRMNIEAARIRQVVDNLIDNARKYSQPGTTIEVGARRLKGEIIISVTDHGVGIPASELPRIFDKMYRLERRLAPTADGLGLGLPLCKGLVEAHGGRIWMESEEGKGSIGYFSLPLIKES